MTTEVELSSYDSLGAYPLPNAATFDEMQTTAKVQKIAIAILAGAITALSVTVIPVSMPIGLALVAASGYFLTQAVLSVLGVYNRAPPTQEIFPKEIVRTLPPLEKVTSQPFVGFPTANGIESHQWKLNLIKEARHSIVLSGCYCGGNAFDETLDLIRDQMKKHPTIQTHILSSQAFLTQSNYEKVEEMQKEFGNRFCFLATPELMPLVSPTTGMRTTTCNHIKSLVIDYGSSFLIGGSGIVSPWTIQHGHDKPNDDVENHVILWGALRLSALRDMDFVFHSPELGGVGTRLHVEMIQLFERFRHQKTGEIKTPFTGWPERIESPTGIFAKTPQTVGNIHIGVFPVGPEQLQTVFLDEMIAQVKNAKESIEISHMYFHPPKALLDALIDASNRGVKITLITNKVGFLSPGTHSLFAELSRYFVKQLFEGKEKPNIEVYEYDIPQTTLHKKVMVFDQKTTLIGSSNISTKSLYGKDYELNLKVESPEFGKSVSSALEEDKRLCVKVPDKEAPLLSLKTRIISSIQWFFTNVL